MKTRLLHLVVVAICLSCHVAWAADLKQEFADPALKYAPRPLWFWNNTTVTKEGIVSQMKDARDRCGYGGFGILPFGKSFEPKYLSEEYFQVHKIVDGKHVYFLANLRGGSVEGRVTFKGKLTPETWDPHSGKTSVPEYSHAKIGSVDVTNVQIELEHLKSVFVVARDGAT